MKKFEYTSIMHKDWYAEPEEELNKLGAEGWELVSVHVTDPGIPTRQTQHFWLKREAVSK